MLYKYLPKERVDVIENLRIRFTQPTSLNDPFECLPLIDASTEMKAIIESHNEYLDDLWYRTPEDERTPERLETLNKAKQKAKEAALKELAPHAIGTQIGHNLSKRFGVLSVSRSDTNLLMWSHYASDNAGYQIGFDENHEFICPRGQNGEKKKPRPVTYSSHCSHIAVKNENHQEKLFCEKPIEWAYEEEERIFSILLDPMPPYLKDSYRSDIYLADIPKDAIKRIVLGARMNKETEERIIDSVRSHEMDAEIHKARMSELEYKVEFEIIERA